MLLILLLFLLLKLIQTNFQLLLMIQNKVIRCSLAVSFTGDGVKRINYIIYPVEFLDNNLDDNRSIIYKNLIDFVTYFHYHARKGRITEKILLILLVDFQLIIQLLLIILIQLNLMK